MPKIIIGNTVREATPQEIAENSINPPPPPTASELDDLADRVTQQEFENDAHTKAIGRVMADIVAQAFGVSDEIAWREVKTRFREYYRGSLDG